MVGAGPLGRVPPASFCTACIAVEFKLGKPLGNGKEKGAAAARFATAEVRATVEKRMFAMYVNVE